MDIQHVEAFARGLGALPSAVEDVVRRAVHHFGDTEPDHEALTTWGTALKAQCTHLFVAAPGFATVEQVAATHGVPVAVWEKMSPEERSSRARSLTPPVQKQRSQPVVMTPERQKILDGLTNPVARNGQYYQWQAEDAHERALQAQQQP